MNPTRKKNLLSSFSVGAQSHGNTHCSQGRQDSIAQRDAAAPLQRLSARAAKERQEKNNNQNSNGVFFSS
jgi:hypothetical protein